MERLAFVAAVVSVLLAGCQSVHVTTAASGTQVQAREVVRYVNDSGGSLAQIPYRAGDIAPAVERIRTRFAQLRPAFDAGVIGLTSDGWVAFREGVARTDELARLVARENFDRHILYSASAAEVGHGINDWFGDWMPYQHATFGGAWVAQAPSGWWLRDESGRWVRKPEAGTKAR